MAKSSRQPQDQVRANRTRASEITKRLISAAELFAERNPYPDQMRQGWSVWWHVVPEADSLIQAAVQDLVRSNPTQLSPGDTQWTLTFATQPSLSLLALRDKSGYPQFDMVALETALQDLVLELISRKRSRWLQFIVENIVVDVDVPPFFGVHLKAPTSEELQALYDDPLIRSPHTNAVALATVSAPGDSSTAFRWGARQVERFLSLLQGCASDRVYDNYFPVHIIDRNPVLERTPVRELPAWPGTSNVRASLRQQDGFTRLRHARVGADLLADLKPHHAKRLVDVSTSSNAPELATAIVACLETLGESCKPHLASTRMLLVSSSLEMLVGARIGEDVAFRGVTAAIAERATFLAGGQTLDERVQFDRRVRRLYRTGSAVRHGGRPHVPPEEIAELAAVTRRVALALLEKPDLATHEALDAWIQHERYSASLPRGAGAE